MSTSTTPFWKKIYQTVSGHSQSVTEDIVAEILNLSRSELFEGLSSYKPYTKKGYDDWVPESTINTCMKEFVHDLSVYLNLDTSITYSVMCNYLMFEYYGKIKEFWQITRSGTTANLKESIWVFYTSERMFLLKTWRHIFEFVNKNDEFSEQYKDFLKTTKIDELQDHLINQYETLLDEITLKRFEENSVYLDNWLCRNMREQTEILLIIVLTISHKNFDIAKLSQLIKLLAQSNFGTQPVLYEMKEHTKPEDLEDLMYTAIGCYCAILENFWDMQLSDFWKKESTIELDKSVLSLHLTPGHTIIMLYWKFLKFKSFQSESDAEQILDFLKRKPFVLLHRILSNKIFKNCTVGEIVLRATHKMLDELCLMFIEKKILYEDEGIAQILAEFLNQSDLAEICLQTREGLDAIMEIAIQTFPYDFFSFTAITKSLLAQKNQYEKTVDMLNHIPTFLTDMTWAIPNAQISILKGHQRALPDSDLIVFPPQTVIRSYSIFDQNLVQYKGTYSYYLYLEYLVQRLINNILFHRSLDENLVKKVIAGFGVVIQAIKYCKGDLKELKLERIILKLDKLLIHLDSTLLHFDLINLYFQLHNEMMIHRQSSYFDNCPEIVWKIIFPKLKTEYTVPNVDVNTLLLNEYLFEETIFLKLFDQEEFKEDHSLIMTYIKILRNILKVKLQFRYFQLSGFAYLLNRIFLQHQAWIYKDKNQKTQITLECLSIFHYILQKEVDDLTDFEKQIFDLCQHAFLHNAYVIETFLRLFVKEKYYLVILMERESNWNKGPSLDNLKCIRMQLALLLLIMNRKKAVTKCIFNNKITCVVKPVASYFTNSYSSVIAELSCRFLGKLAQESHIPLLALLELDHYQIQSLFLERLRDPLEEEKVKIAIIDLINTCISNQNGMTAAFFNLKCFMYWDGSEDDVYSGDSVSDFMVDYLQNIKKSHDYFKNPLQLGILRLLYNLWLTHRENLIESIANLKDFWPVMADPFFSDFVQGTEVYSTILRIINLEIGYNLDKIEENLVKTIDKFLKDKERLTKWITFVLESSENNSQSNQELLSAWMEFLVITRKVVPESFEDDVKMALIISCLDGLNLSGSGFDRIEITYLWSQLYLVLITTWPVYQKEDQLIVSKLTNFLHPFSTYYKHLKPKDKETILCAINKTIIDLHTYFSSSTPHTLAFLKPLGKLINQEYDYCVTDVWKIEDGIERIRQLKPWLIIIFIGNSIVTLDNLDEIGLWFYYEGFIQKVMDSVGPMLKIKNTLSFAKLAIDFLITYAESSLAKDFLRIDLFDFYYKIKPPHLTISVGEAILSGLPGDLKEWWMIFITLVRLNRALLQNIGSSMIETCFLFITQHDKSLKEIICLTKYTVDMTALTLVSETLKFVFYFICRMPRWSVESLKTYDLVIDGVKTTINACVLSILGHKKINFYRIIDRTNLDVMNSTPSDLLVSVLNKLTEIIYLGTTCLKMTKPDLVTQLNFPDKCDYLPFLIENDFNVPRFELPIISKLTYGTLLCLADFLCKTLTQLSPETPSANPSRQVSLTEVKEKNLGKLFEHCTATYERCIGFMVYLQRSGDLMNEKLSSLLHYDLEFSSASSPISQLDYHLVKNALESVMSFLAGEIFFTIQNLDEETLFSYTRELSSEIQFFYEFVRKRTGEQYNVMVATPRSTTSISQSESDIIKKYILAKVNDNDTNDIIDNNFVLVIAQWLIKICHLSN